MFKLVSNYKPDGDQPEAIKKLVEGIKEKTCLIYPWKHALLNSREITALDL